MTVPGLHPPVAEGTARVVGEHVDMRIVVEQLGGEPFDIVQVGEISQVVGGVDGNRDRGGLLG